MSWRIVGAAARRLVLVVGPLLTGACGGFLAQDVQACVRVALRLLE